VLASRLAGHDVERVLVDVSPYSFGPSYLGERGGVPYPHCYKPIIRRNTPLPVTRTESYFTAYPRQTEVRVEIFQGDDEDALKNIPVGDFLIERLTPLDEPSEVLCRMNLDIDGILNVTAIEKCTGKSKHIRITNALQAKSDVEIAAARKRIEDLYASREPSAEDYEDEGEAGDLATNSGGETEDRLISDSQEPADIDGNGAAMNPPGWTETRRNAVALIQRSRRLLDSMHGQDKDEALKLQQEIESAVTAHDSARLQAGVKTLEELLFFVEGA
jgi:molecular chaperone DnaK (HSP70)